MAASGEGREKEGKLDGLLLRIHGQNQREEGGILLLCS
jgi:hypothetical protein